MKNTSIFKLFKPLNSVLKSKKMIAKFEEAIGHNILDLLFYLPTKAITLNFCDKWEQLEDKKIVTIKVIVNKHYSNYFNKKLPYRITVSFNNKPITLTFFSKYTGY